MKYKIGVKVMPRHDVLDIQGRAVQETLTRHGQSLNECRIGRYIELTIDADNLDQALQKAEGVSNFVLFNPLIETHVLEEIKG